MVRSLLHTHRMRKSKVLLVDDDPRLSRTIKVFLERLGPFEVREVNKPATACLAALDFRPNLIILDVDMPGMDGGDVHRALSAEPALRETPIAFLSGLVGAKEAGKRDGTHYFSKPVDPGALVRAIHQILVDAECLAA